jgi:hypothetical protein
MCCAGWAVQFAGGAFSWLLCLLLCLSVLPVCAAHIWQYSLQEVQSHEWPQGHRVLTVQQLQSLGSFSHGTCLSVLPVDAAQVLQYSLQELQSHLITHY